MKLPLSWLNEYVKVDDIKVKDLAKMLVGIGFEVEEIIYTGENIEKIITAKIIDIKPHPDAVKLSVCIVDTGKENLTIVTGANNVQVGSIIPLALDGAVLPGGKTIVSSPLRGIMSYGMICSGGELGIDNSVYPGAEDHGILLLKPDTKAGVDIKDVLGLNEYVFDVSLTANRPDCQSVYGLAREVSAVLGRKIKPLNLDYKTVKTDKKVSVKISNYNLCSRYTARLIENVKIAESPEIIKKRLRLCGLKPINNVVDITNYVLLEIGQPLHAFDLSFIEGGINVREAYEGEIIKALDEKEYKLKNTMLVIADDKKPLAIAGIMGGEFSGINSGTSCVLLEAARFARGSIRSSSRQLGLRSDSSARYEKGVDWQSVDAGRERALALFCELNAGDVTDFANEDSIPVPSKKIIQTSGAQISGVLGIKVTPKKIAGILNLLGIETTLGKKGALSCVIPLFREDIDNFTDIAEEMIRFYGYDKIKSTMFKPSAITSGGLPVRQKRINEIKNYMTAAGAYEIITYSFLNYNKYDQLGISKDDSLRDVIKIINPLSEEYGVMRTQIISSMLDTVYVNTSRKNDNFRLFEIARTYNAKELPLKELPEERETLSAAFLGSQESFYSLKSVIAGLLDFYKLDYSLEYSKKVWLRPGISADIFIGGELIGSFGKIHPSAAKKFNVPESLFLAEVCIEKILGKNIENIKFAPLPKFPLVERDLAVTVKADCYIGNLIKTVRNACALVEDVELFDIYQGEQIEKGFKSVAFSIKLRSPDKTLTDQEIQNAMTLIMEKLQEDHGAKIRM